MIPHFKRQKFYNAVFSNLARARYTHGVVAWQLMPCPLMFSSFILATLYFEWAFSLSTHTPLLKYSWQLINLLLRIPNNYATHLQSNNSFVWLFYILQSIDYIIPAFSLLPIIIMSDTFNIVLRIAHPKQCKVSKLETRNLHVLPVAKKKEICIVIVLCLRNSSLFHLI